MHRTDLYSQTLEKAMPDITFRDAWLDPNVIMALKTRIPTDIMVIGCPNCANYGHYNEGSHWSCSVEGCDHAIGSDRLDEMLDEGLVITLEEYAEMKQYAEENDIGY